MWSKQLLSPGNQAIGSGQYKLIGPRGGDLGIEITAIKGKTLPPSPKPGIQYLFIDATKNKSGGKK